MEERQEIQRGNMEKKQEYGVKQIQKEEREIQERRAVASCSSSATPRLMVINPSN